MYRKTGKWRGVALWNMQADAMLARYLPGIIEVNQQVLHYMVQDYNSQPGDVKKPADLSAGFSFSVAEPGFEPRQTESESVVLPLYYRAIAVRLFPYLYFFGCKDN